MLLWVQFVSSFLLGVVSLSGSDGVELLLVAPILFFTRFFFLVCIGKIHEMATQLWTGAEGELATERDQIPTQGLEVGQCYQVLPVSAYSPSDFTVRLRNNQEKYLSLMSELLEIYMAKPDWLRLRSADFSRHIPVAYIDRDDWIGRGYVAMELADNQCVLYDADDGSFDFIVVGSVFRLGVDHASVPAFCSRVAVAGVRPRAEPMWSRQVCSATGERIMSSSLFIQVEMIREETVVAQARCETDGFFLDAWLIFTNFARPCNNRVTLYPHLEEEQDVL